MKTMYAARDFKDAGTGRSFARGEPITAVDEGILGNYEAAKLVTDEDPNAVAAEAPQPEAIAAEEGEQATTAPVAEAAEGDAAQTPAEPQADTATDADAEPKSTRRRKAADAD